MSRLLQPWSSAGCVTVDKPLPQVLVRVSDALQAAGFGLLTVVEVPPRAPVGNLVCEISCLTAPPNQVAAPKYTQVLPGTIRLQAQGEQTVVSTAMRYAVAASHPPAGETGAAQAAWTCVQHVLRYWLVDGSTQEKENGYPL